MSACSSSWSISASTFDVFWRALVSASCTEDPWLLSVDKQVFWGSSNSYSFSLICLVSVMKSASSFTSLLWFVCSSIWSRFLWYAWTSRSWSIELIFCLYCMLFSAASSFFAYLLFLCLVWVAETSTLFFLSNEFRSEGWGAWVERYVKMCREAPRLRCDYALLLAFYLGFITSFWLSSFFKRLDPNLS